MAGISKIPHAAGATTNLAPKETKPVESSQATEEVSAPIGDHVDHEGAAAASAAKKFKTTQAVKTTCGPSALVSVMTADLKPRIADLKKAGNELLKTVWEDGYSVFSPQCQAAAKLFRSMGIEPDIHVGSAAYETLEGDAKELHKTEWILGQLVSMIEDEEDGHVHLDKFMSEMINIDELDVGRNYPEKYRSIRKSNQAQIDSLRHQLGAKDGWIEVDGKDYRALFGHTHFFATKGREAIALVKGKDGRYQRHKGVLAPEAGNAIYTLTHGDKVTELSINNSGALFVTDDSPTGPVAFEAAAKEKGYEQHSHRTLAELKGRPASILVANKENHQWSEDHGTLVIDESGYGLVALERDDGSRASISPYDGVIQLWHAKDD